MLCFGVKPGGRSTTRRPLSTALKESIARAVCPAAEDVLSYEYRMNGFPRWLAPQLLRQSKGHYRQDQAWRLLGRFVTTLPSRPSHLKEENDHEQAMEWIKSFEIAGPDAIPANAYTITMSRSSGPGGQNVNKLSTKATLRLPLDKAKTSGWLPGFVIPELMKTPYFSTTPPSLLISSSATRLAASNRADSVAKLHDVICTTAQSMIVKPTSEEQKLKVRDLMGKDAARRKAEKVKKSMKKESRRKGGWD